MEIGLRLLYGHRLCIEEPDRWVLKFPAHDELPELKVRDAEKMLFAVSRLWKLAYV